jgi:hypothetical protein
MCALTTWAPMSSLKQEMDRLFDRFFEPQTEEALRTAPCPVMTIRDASA